MEQLIALDFYFRVFNSIKLLIENRSIYDSYLIQGVIIFGIIFISILFIVKIIKRCLMDY